MAERAIPAAHAETKLLMGARQWSRGKGTPEGGQPMSSLDGGPTQEFRKGLKDFRGAIRGCQFYSGAGSIIEMVSRGTHGQHHLCFLGPWGPGSVPGRREVQVWL